MNFERDVDIVVGAQYGDEGKGMVAKLLADEAEINGTPYNWTARVGGQNAEHRFIHKGCPYWARILPSASAHREISVMLGAGHCFRPEQLLREAKHMQVPLNYIYVDSQAMWLQEYHRTLNREASEQRGTTGWGVGAAVAEKVLRKSNTQLIRDCTTLPEVCVRSVARVIAGMNGPGLFEGSQGALLSLDHGTYPYCTSKNVTVPAMCGELGISLKRVRRVIGVVRLVPMRVPGASGPTGGEETTYDVLEEETGLRIPQAQRMQGDATKSTEERVFKFNMGDLLFSHCLNGYDALVITFADYHREGNYRVTELTDLHPDTLELIHRIEEEVAPVLLVRTGPGEYDNIWLKE